MQRFHDTRNDPLPLHSTLQDAERQRLELATQAFLAKGGQIDQIGHQMSDAPTTFVINPERTPVYAHLYQPPVVEPVRLPEPEPAAAPAEDEPAVGDDQEARQAGQVMAAAAMGDSPKWIAKKLHMTEKRVRQLARDYHINFRAQR